MGRQPWRRAFSQGRSHPLPPSPQCTGALSLASRLSRGWDGSPGRTGAGQAGGQGRAPGALTALLSAWLPGRSGLRGGGGPEGPSHVLVHPEVRQGEPPAAVPGAPAAVAPARRREPTRQTFPPAPSRPPRALRNPGPRGGQTQSYFCKDARGPRRRLAEDGQWSSRRGGREVPVAPALQALACSSEGPLASQGLRAGLGRRRVVSRAGLLPTLGWMGTAADLGPADLPGQGPLCRRGGCPRPREQQGTLCANFWGHHARCGHPRAAPSPTVPGAGSRGQPSLRREAGNGWTRAHTHRTQSAELCSGGEAELGGVLTPHTPFCQLRGNQAPPVAAPPSSLGIAGVPTPSRASLLSCG